MSKIGVMVIDDSAVVRQVLAEVLGRDPSIELAGTAIDPLFAIEKMRARWPDVIVLDIEMPRMDGLTFLRKLMAQRPTPVVICSSLTDKGAQIAMDALAAGAVSVVAKPGIGVRRFLMEDAAEELLQAVKGAAQVRLRQLRLSQAQPVPPKLCADAVLAPPGSAAPTRTTERVVAIGTSTGGTQALEAVLTALPHTAPGVVVVQHMPEKFTASFAVRLDQLCQIEVREARDRDRVMRGLALIAPGGRHLLVKRSGAHYHVEVVDGPLVSRHRPSVDVLFRSAAKYAGRNALGIIMTGMGDDGAHGLKEMRDAGALTLAQDETSCVVYGMPGEAVKLGAVERSVALHRIAAEIESFDRA